MCHFWLQFMQLSSYLSSDIFKCNYINRNSKNFSHFSFTATTGTERKIQRFLVWKLSFSIHIQIGLKLATVATVSFYPVACTLHSLYVLYSSYAWIHSGWLVYSCCIHIRNVKRERFHYKMGVANDISYGSHILTLCGSAQCSALYIENDGRKTQEEEEDIYKWWTLYNTIVHNDGSEQHSGVSIYLMVVSFRFRSIFFAFKVLSVRVVPSLMLQFFHLYFSFEV